MAKMTKASRDALMKYNPVRVRGEDILKKTKQTPKSGKPTKTKKKK